MGIPILVWKHHYIETPADVVVQFSWTVSVRGPASCWLVGYILWGANSNICRVYPTNVVFCGGHPTNTSSIFVGCTPQMWFYRVQLTIYGWNLNVIKYAKYGFKYIHTLWYLLETVQKLEQNKKFELHTYILSQPSCYRLHPTNIVLYCILEYWK